MPRVVIPCHGCKNKVRKVLSDSGGDAVANCKPVATPCDTKAKASTQNGTPVTDPSFYGSMAGALQYLTLTR